MISAPFCPGADTLPAAVQISTFSNARRQLAVLQRRHPPRAGNTRSRKPKNESTSKINLSPLWSAVHAARRGARFFGEFTSGSWSVIIWLDSLILDIPKRRIALSKTKPATKAKEVKGAAARPRSARVYRVVEKKASAAEKLTSKQALAVYNVLARNKAGLTAAQVLEKLSGTEKFVSKNPASVLAAVLYDLRKGTGVCTKVGPGLVQIVGKPEATPAPIPAA
jgi:hypothetical protein